jgi:type II secretory pathway component PulF
MNFASIIPVVAAHTLDSGVAMPFVRGWLLPVLFPICALVGAIFYINSRPLRRQEGARFLLDLIESAVEQGQSIERYIVSLTQAKDSTTGVRFNLFAAYLERGHTLGTALEKVPELLPAQVTAMLKVGESMGDYSRVLPACRLLLRDGTSQVRALINYQIAFGLVANPVLLFLLPLLGAKVLPVFRDIGRNFNLVPPAAAASITTLIPFLCVVQFFMILACFGFAVFMLGGTRFTSWLQGGMLPFRAWSDRVQLWLPWRRKRLQRDFAAMLGLLLDAGQPEQEAVRLAAASTANLEFVRRAEQAAEKLRSGVKLTEAVQILDDTGEFRWRLTNAAHGGGFFSALKGWQASLEARAFQLEQAAAQTISTSLLLINAATVALIAAGLYQFLSQLTGASFVSLGFK